MKEWLSEQVLGGWFDGGRGGEKKSVSGNEVRMSVGTRAALMKEIRYTKLYI